MWETLLDWFGSRAWEPHGHCFLWTPSLLWTLVGSNLLIAAAYYSIPLTLLTMVRRRSDLVHRPTFLLFAAFIFGCGTTHLVKVWTIWQPVYSLQGGVDAATAGVSVLTALMLWPLLPRFLSLPSHQQLQVSNQALAAEVSERKQAEAELRQIHAELERRVEERTAELRQKNQQLEKEIEERIAVEQALRSSELRFRQLANSMPQLVWTADADGTVDYYNDRVQEFQGIERTADDGWEWAPVVHPDDEKRTVQAWQTAVATGEPYEIEHRILRADGQAYWHLSRGLPVHDGNGTVMKWYGTATDIHAQKSVEAERDRLIMALAEEREQLQRLNETLEIRVDEQTGQVRSLAARLSLAEHDERKRISQILHDHVQQILYAVQMRIHLAELELPPGAGEKVRSHLAIMNELTMNAVHTTRTLTVEMSPPVLEQEGLPEAIGWLRTQMNDLHDLEVVLSVEGDCRVRNKSLRVLIFQIIRELLFNVVKHADVRIATVELRCRNGVLAATIRDGGRGFEVSTLTGEQRTQRGFGLASIRERLDLFGGTMRVETSPDRGTIVTIQLAVD